MGGRLVTARQPYGYHCQPDFIVFSPMITAFDLNSVPSARLRAARFTSVTPDDINRNLVIRHRVDWQFSRLWTMVFRDISETISCLGVFRSSLEVSSYVQKASLIDLSQGWPE